MNDNRHEVSGIEIHLLGYFIIDPEWFDFYSRLPGFRAVEVYDRRIGSGETRRLSVQIADRESFLHVTEYRFRAHRR